MATKAALPSADEQSVDHGAHGASLLAEVMTAQQIAGLLQMPVSTIEDYARRRVLPSIKLGRHRRFIRSDVEEAISDLLQTPVQRPLRRRRDHPWSARTPRMAA